MSHDHGSTDDMSGMMMSSWFHFGLTETVLFKFWQTDNIGGLLGSILFIFFLAVAYEALKFYREYLYKNHYKIPKDSKQTSKSSQEFAQVHMLSYVHLWQTVLHMVQTNVSYFLMLIFMTYNVWLCFAVAFGGGVGYFLFGCWKKAPVVDESCNCK